MRTMTTADNLTEIVVLRDELVRFNTKNQPIVVKLSGDRLLEMDRADHHSKE